MNTTATNKTLRVATLVVVLGTVLFAADHFFGGCQPKTLAAILGAIAGIFFLAETYFWKALDKISELPHSEALSVAEAKDLSTRVQALKSRLAQRWLILLVLKAAAGGCAAWLFNLQSPADNQRLVWLTGVGALTVSLPMALTFLRNWQQADSIKNQQLLRARERQEIQKTKDELSISPAKSISADKVLTGYTKVTRTTKVKNGSA